MAEAQRNLTEKACRACKQVLPAKEFQRSSKRKDGLQARFP